MNLVRGFRRLLVVLSVAVIGLGTALDVGRLWSHAKIYATLTDGSTEVYATWSLVGSPPYERDPATRQMVIDLLERKPINLDQYVLSDQLPPGYILDPVRSLKTFRVVRGPAAWSWTDIRFMPISAGAVVLLWAGFFALRWVVRGFTSQQ